jgi:uncharacterized protein
MAETETIDQQFIEYIVKTLVGNPDAVKVTRTIDERGVLLELHVEPEDLGRVIGRNGGTAKSIRTLLRALGVKNDARYNLKIIDTNEGGRPPRRDDRQEPREDQPQDAPSEEPVSDAPADDAADTSADDTVSEEPQVEETPEEAPPEENSMDRHREDLKDLNDLDI